jgi:hypothetical protein
MTDRTPAFYIDQGNKISEAVGLYIEQVFERKKYPEQGYRSCQGILSFAKRYGHERLTNACKRAHEVGYFNFKIIENFLQKNIDQYEQEEPTPEMPTHKNIRGKEYYQ